MLRFAAGLGCPQGSEDGFGPFSNCRFDFTLYFEQSTLSALPSLIFTLLVFPRIYFLRRQDRKIAKNSWGPIKLVLGIACTVVQLILLVLWVKSPSNATAATVPAAALNIIAAINVALLSFFEHSYSLRPSTLLVSYLALTCLFDLAQARTLFLLGDCKQLAVAEIAVVISKFVLLLFESQEKTSYLRPKYQHLSPESTSGIISRSLLWWLNGVFFKGYKSLSLFLSTYQLDPDLESRVVAEKAQNTWNDRARPEGRLALILSLSKALGGQFLLVIFPRLCLIGFTFAQPFLISSVLSLLSEVDDETTQERAYSLIACTALIYCGIAISYLLSAHNLYRLITMFRGATVSLIYNHSLSLGEAAYDVSGAVTLMGNDVDQITFCLEELNECWSRLLEVIIALPLLTRQLGWVSVIPLLVVCLSGVGSSIITKLIGESQRIWADATEKRIILTSSMLRQMKTIKMSGFSDVMSNAVQNERIEELRKRGTWGWIIVWMNVVANTPLVLAPAATFAIYAIQATLIDSEPLNTVQAFTSLALISLVANPASRLLHAVPNTARSIGSFDRIQAFLLIESQEDLKLELKTSSPKLPTEVRSPRQAVSHSNPLAASTVHEEGGHSRLAMKVTNAYIRPSKASDFALKDVNLSVEVGKLVMVLGPVGSGKSTLIKALLGEVGYDSGTIDVARERLGYCAQSPWLINGTIKEAICGLGTDGVDETWYTTVLEACALRYDMNHLTAGDQTIIGSRGITLSGGQKQRIALARAIYSRARILLLDDILSALDNRTEREIMAHLFKKDGLFRKMGSTVVLITHAVQYVGLADQLIVFGPDGKVRQEKPEALQTGSFSSSQEQIKTPSQDAFHDELAEGLDANPSKIEIEVQARDLQRQPGDIEVYRYYFRSVGMLNVLLLVAFVLLNVSSASFSQIWLKWWTDIDGKQVTLYASIYFLFAVGYSLGEAGFAWVIVIVIAGSTGRKLHQILLKTVMKAPVSFFAITDLGSILNRFSQDMTLIEVQLASALLSTVFSLFTVLAQAALVALGSPWIILTVPVLFAVLYCVQRIYLQTSRQLRLLDLESRSPVYSHFLETLEGLSTIRAFGWQDKFSEINLKRLDDSQKPYYLMFCIQQWLGLVLDLIVAALAVIVVSLALNLKGTTTVGLLGVSLNNVLAFSESLSDLLRGWTSLETSLGAIARLRDFEIETESEERDGEDMIPPEDWPSSGMVLIEGLTAYYGSKKALDNIILRIEPGQTVAICGRTGSGKSTLLSSILRTIDPSSGSIKVDSVELSRIPRSLLRQRLITVPQEPLHMIGTVRFNTDPFGEASDELIISALEKVNLWAVLLERGGLDTELAADMLSKGQQQLLALARALIRKKKSRLALLDEATSSTDAETRRMLNETLRRELADCTVLMVAHRKETILSADLVVLMDSGRVVEVGTPADLMRAPDSPLRELLLASAGESER